MTPRERLIVAEALYFDLLASGARLLKTLAEKLSYAPHVAAGARGRVFGITVQVNDNLPRLRRKLAGHGVTTVVYVHAPHGHTVKLPERKTDAGEVCSVRLQVRVSVQVFRIEE